MKIGNTQKITRILRKGKSKTCKNVETEERGGGEFY